MTKKKVIKTEMKVYKTLPDNFLNISFVEGARKYFYYIVAPDWHLYRSVGPWYNARMFYKEISWFEVLVLTGKSRGEIEKQIQESRKNIK